MDTIIIIILLVIVVNILIRKYQTNKTLKDPLFIELISEADTFLKQVDDYKMDYFVNSAKELLKDKYKSTYDKLSNNKQYLRLNNQTVSEFIEVYSIIDKLVEIWNEEYIKRELEANKHYFDNIDGKSLDEQQRRAVVVDEDNNIIVAGAGSGKTLSISGKVKYLVEKKNVNPDEILLISFTKKASEEMQERIEKRLDISVKARTFHALGYEILMKTYTYRSDVFNDLNRVVDNYFKNVAVSDKDIVYNIITFFGYYFSIPKDLEEFDSLGEVHDQVKDIDFETIKSKVERKRHYLKKEKITLKGELVKSQEEVIIANFLYLNGIKYEYEKVYPFPSDEPYRKQYRPDFYLTEYGLYLEHFGITRDYKTPWLSEIESKKYIAGIKWKREMHERNHTTLLETYSYYNREGILITKLEEILRRHNVKFIPVNYQEIYTSIFADDGDRYFKEFKKLVCTFIGLFKSSGYSLSNFENLNEDISKMENSFLKERTRIFLSIIKPIYLAYQDKLKKHQMIDFNDMINLATESIKSGVIKLNYKYIIIDEYQDISVSRYNLIKAIKEQTGAKIIAVGDDWQSIYRFTGSDIGLFTKFKEYFGYSKNLKIERTYRNSQELIDISGRFIMKNKNQIVKSLISNKRYSNPIRILGYIDIMDVLIKAVEEIVLLYGEETEIMVIGRNNFDIELFRKKEDIEDNLIKEDVFKPIETSQILITKENEQVKINYKKYPNLSIYFTTAHKSKGLEAENVIIINLENKLVGFPNKISDDPLLSLVLTDKDDFIYAEERRVFYVSLTRTKNTCYLLVPDNNKSLFVDELIKEHKILYEFSNNEESITNNPNCPKCQTGALVIRENGLNSSKFLGCTNYPLCDYTLSNIEVLNNQMRCPSCGGYMVRRNGKFGEFYGCTNFPYCNKTINIDKTSKYEYNSIKKVYETVSIEDTNKPFISDKTLDGTLEQAIEKRKMNLNANDKKYNSSIRRFNDIKRRVSTNKDIFMFDPWLSNNLGFDIDEIVKDAVADAMGEVNVLDNSLEHIAIGDTIIEKIENLEHLAEPLYREKGKILRLGDNIINGERVEIAFDQLINEELLMHISDFEYEVKIQVKNDGESSVTKLGIGNFEILEIILKSAFSLFDVGTGVDLILGWITPFKKNEIMLDMLIRNEYMGITTYTLRNVFFDKVESYLKTQGIDKIVAVLSYENRDNELKNIKEFLINRGYRVNESNEIMFELNL